MHTPYTHALLAMSYTHTHTHLVQLVRLDLEFLDLLVPDDLSGWGPILVLSLLGWRGRLVRCSITPLAFQPVCSHTAMAMLNHHSYFNCVPEPIGLSGDTGNDSVEILFQPILGWGHGGWGHREQFWHGPMSMPEMIALLPIGV